MLQPIDVNAELSKLSFLHNRNSDTTDEEKAKSFTTLADYRDGGIFTGSFSGVSQWERHEQGDEIVHVLDGATTFTIMTDDGPQQFEMTKGMMMVVPQGHWHLFEAPEGVTIMTITPQPTEHIHADDPRSVEFFARLEEATS